MRFDKYVEILRFEIDFFAENAKDLFPELSDADLTQSEWFEQFKCLVPSGTSDE